MRQGVACEEAFVISEDIRKGKVQRLYDENKMSKRAEIYRGLPEKFRKVAEQSKYVIPRSEVVNAIILYYLLSFYMKKDSKTYGKIVFQNKKWASEFKEAALIFYK